MNRRQFIISVGGLATAGSGVIGSGAFSTVSAERNVSINVETDQEAYLIIKGISTNFVDGSDVKGFDFDNEVASNEGGFEATGEGVSANSVYEFTDLLQIQNQGTDPVVVFGKYTGDELVSLELTTSGRQSPLKQSNPSEVISAPGEFIKVGLQMEIGDISVQKLETEISIVGVSKNSEVFPGVFPEDGS